MPAVFRILEARRTDAFMPRALTCGVHLARLSYLNPLFILSYPNLILIASLPYFVADMSRQGR